MKIILASSNNTVSSLSTIRKRLLTLIIGSSTIQTSCSFSFGTTQQAGYEIRNIITTRNDKWHSQPPLLSSLSSDEWTTTTNENQDDNNQRISLLTASSSISRETISNNVIPQNIFSKEVLQVLSAAFLITANTVGPSMMVVPNIVAGPGFLISSLMLCGVWGFNLLSALLIAEVAINQYEISSNDNEIPSSFKDFAELNLQNKAAGFFVSFLCIFVNWCVVSFNLMRMGEIVVANVPTYTAMMEDFFTSSSSTLLPTLYSFATSLSVGSSSAASEVASSLSSLSSTTPLNTAASLSAFVWMALVGTQSSQRLSGVASICCLGLFASFASILLPGLMNIQSNPLLLSTASSSFDGPLEADFGSVVLGALPVFISVMIFQNMVPTVVKVLDFDRTKCVQAMIVGSSIPLVMHLTFSYAVLGGGIDLDLSSGGPLVNIFSIVSVVGSTMACVMSLAGEFDCFFGGVEEKEEYATTISNDKVVMEGEAEDVASIPAVALAVLPPLLAGIYFSDGEEFVQAISVAGSYASPLLYGVIPALLAFNQRRQKDDGIKTNVKSQEMFQQLAPGGVLGLGVLGVASMSLIWERAMMDLSSIGI